MIQNALFGNQQRPAGITEDTASVVALDRQDDQEIVLRFLMDSSTWSGHAQQIRISKGMAEQLVQMLSDELQESSEPFHYKYA